ncbi:hypothetical protein ACQ4PT_014922 [Festuca glaucescens]
MEATATTLTVALAKLVLDQMGRMEQNQNQKKQKQKETKLVLDQMQQDVIAVKDDLEATQAFLKDMKGSNQGQSHMLKSYVRLVRDLAYDGEDCLQEFLLFLEQPPRAKASPKLVLTQEVISAMLKNLRIKVDSTRAKLRYCADAAGLTVQTGSGIGTLPLSRRHGPFHLTIDVDLRSRVASVLAATFHALAAPCVDVGSRAALP